MILAPYAGATRRSAGLLSPEYSRWLRSRWIAQYGRKTKVHRWQPHEDGIALDMRGRGKSYGQIAIRVHRTPDAVAARLRYLSQPRLVAR